MDISFFSNYEPTKAAQFWARLLIVTFFSINLLVNKNTIKAKYGRNERQFQLQINLPLRHFCRQLLHIWTTVKRMNGNELHSFFKWLLSFSCFYCVRILSNRITIHVFICLFVYMLILVLVFHSSILHFHLI